MLSGTALIRIAVKFLFAGVIFVTALALALRGAMRLVSAKQAGVKQLMLAENSASLTKAAA